MDYAGRSGGVHVAFEYRSSMAGFNTSFSTGGIGVDLDVVFSGSTPLSTFPFTAEVGGVVMRMSHSLQSLFALKYRAPRKTMKQGEDIVCHDLGHSACLPNCTAAGDGATLDCEFPDRFVELDYFE
mmetsp:Transcript_127970/g.370326  ORF Transcript_127970/g.370326 Transcript_127970/m.370326 type:complete len:126 (+) Transcript_127970:1-378(+)